MTDLPFLSFYTPTYKRPQALARCQASVGAQTLLCEQLVIRDEIGIGIAGMYAAIPLHAHGLSGQYVHLLADDDWLAAPDVAAQVQAAVWAHHHPDVVIVRAVKAGLDLPLEPHGPPVEGRIDLACVITRRDVWLAHVHDYGQRYEGDYDHVSALWTAGRRFVYTDILFAYGPASHGRPE